MLADLEDDMVPGQNESDKDRYKLFICLCLSIVLIQAIGFTSEGSQSWWYWWGSKGGNCFPGFKGFIKDLKHSETVSTGFCV